MAKVEVPIVPLWRVRAGGRTKVSVECGTVAEVIAHLADEVPALRDWLIEPDGTWPEHINVFVNGHDVRMLAGEQTPVGPDDQIQIVPAISGG